MIAHPPHPRRKGRHLCGGVPGPSQGRVHHHQYHCQSCHPGASGETVTPCWRTGKDKVWGSREVSLSKDMSPPPPTFQVIPTKAHIFVPGLGELSIGEPISTRDEKHHQLLIRDLVWESSSETLEFLPLKGFHLLLQRFVQSHMKHFNWALVVSHLYAGQWIINILKFDF